MAAPGEIIHKQFLLKNPSTRIAADADEPPTAVFLRNGADTAVSCAITRTALGTYSVAITVPATYTTGDEIALRITATVAGLNQSRIFDLGEVEARTAVASGSTTDDWLTNLQTARGNYAQILATISTSPKPSYSVNGQSFSHVEYQRWLLDAIKGIDDLLFEQEGPFENHSVGYT